MIYIYLKILLAYIVLYAIYKSFKEKLPDEITDSITKHKKLVIGAALIFPMVFIGSPYRFESTEFSGKANFSAETEQVTKRVDADKKPVTEDLESELQKLKKQSKDVEDENN